MEDEKDILTDFAAESAASTNDTIQEVQRVTTEEALGRRGRPLHQIIGREALGPNTSPVVGLSKHRIDFLRDILG